MVDVAKTLHDTVDQLRAAGGKVVLVLDQPDLWLATAGTGDGVTNGSLRDLVLDLREVCSTIYLFWLDHCISQSGSLQILKKKLTKSVYNRKFTLQF